LIMDDNLRYIEHGKAVKRKILGRWVAICKYTNRNWGFRQHVIVRLLEVLVSTCIQYAGIVWINNQSIREIEHIWYKMLKSALGAVFNVKRCIAEAILGVIPVDISNKINSIKHFLKLNILGGDDDPLRVMITNHLKTNNYTSLTGKVKEAFHFLGWKSLTEPSHFSVNDLQIIKSVHLEKFEELSSKACSYTKTQIKNYSEFIWQSSMDSQFQLDGFSDSPKVSATKLKFPSKSTRQFETLLLSLFYPNNLLNGFLYRYDKETYDSPLCCCGREEQNTKHLLLNCMFIDVDKRRRMNKYLEANHIHQLHNSHGSNVFLISWSRKPKFFQLFMEIVDDCLEFTRTEIRL
jgi:hypothetical protein